MQRIGRTLHMIPTGRIKILTAAMRSLYVVGIVRPVRVSCVWTRAVMVGSSAAREIVLPRYSVGCSQAGEIQRGEKFSSHADDGIRMGKMDEP